MLTRLTSSGAAVATAPGSPKALQRLQNCIAYLWPTFNAQRVQTKTTQMDAIDNFTNELVSHKTKKWHELYDSMLPKAAETMNVPVPVTNNSTGVDIGGMGVGVGVGGIAPNFSQTMGLMQKAVASDMQAMQSPQLGLDIRLLSQAQLDNLLLSTLEIKNAVDFLYLIRQCILWQQLPSDNVLVACLKYLSNSSHLQYIDALTEICGARGHILTQKLAGFAPFKAIALWRSGGTHVALSTLHAAYITGALSEEGRRLLRNAFRIITEETLRQKSEAVLVNLIDVATKIHLEQHDTFILACVWKQCFISDWFSDQKSAAELFERYPELQSLISRRSTTLCASFLRNNNIDAVHRLIEVFLQHNQREACANCLSSLFNYQHMRKDLRACAEIVKSCSELEMPLSEMQNERFLSLFLDQSDAPAAAKLRKTGQQFQYQF